MPRQHETEFETTDIAIAKVFDSNENPRPEPGSVESLAGNILEIGQVHPITVLEKNGGFELIAGQRRLAACKFLGRTHINARVLRNISKVEALILSVSENTQRKALTVPEIADAALKIERETGKSDREIANLLGIAPSILSQIRSAMVEHDDDVKATLGNAKAPMWLYFLLRKIAREGRNAFAIQCLEAGWTRADAQSIAKGLAPQQEKKVSASFAAGSYEAVKTAAKDWLARLTALERQGIDIKDALRLL